MSSLPRGFCSPGTTHQNQVFLPEVVFVCGVLSQPQKRDLYGRFFFFTIIPDGSGPGRLRDVSIGLLSTAFRNYGFDLETTIPKLEPLWRLLPQCDLGHTSISEEEDGRGTLRMLHLKLPGFCMYSCIIGSTPWGRASW